MKQRLTELRDKEIISIANGKRFGYVSDVELDMKSGEIEGLIVHGKLRFFGLLGREEDIIFPWTSIKRLGDDIILVDEEQLEGRGER